MTEITLDIAALRRAMRAEYALARAEIRAHGPLEAYQRSQRRHDERLAAAADAATLACRKGCHWCCHFSVDVRPVEVLRILAFMQAHFTEQQRAQIRACLEHNAALLAPLDDIGRMQHNVKCPFLEDDGRCSIYPVRPQTCRNYHATNADGCRQSFEDPSNLDIDPDFAPLVYQAGAAHVDAFSKALQDEGYDIDAFEMNAALATALREDDHGAALRRRFEAKAPAFPRLEGLPAPFELLGEEIAATEILAPSFDADLAAGPGSS